MTTLAADPLGDRRVCEGCGMPLPGHDKRYCDGRCRAAAYRARKSAKVEAILLALRGIMSDLEDLVRRGD